MHPILVGLVAQGSPTKSQKTVVTEVVGKEVVVEGADHQKQQDLEETQMIEAVVQS